MGEVGHAKDERGGDQSLQNRAGPRCCNRQSGQTSLGKRKVIERRIEMLTSLTDAYRTQYWELADELLSLKYTGCGKSEESEDEAGLSIQKGIDTIKNAMGTTSKGSLPHAIRLQESVKDLVLGDRKVPKRPRQKNVANKGIDMISRVEMSSYNALCREMDNHGARAMLCGMKYTYYIRSTVVSIGRRAGPGKQTRGTKAVDVDLVEEAVTYGHQDAISRCQARIFLDGDGCFRVYNCGKRGVNVDGSQIEPGKSAVLQHLSLISVAGATVRRSCAIHRWARQVLSSSSLDNAFLHSELGQYRQCMPIQPSKFESGSAEAIQRWRQMGWLSWSARTLTSAESSQLESEKEIVPYRISIVTGDVRGAGSSAPALVTLFGEDGSSESYMLGGDKSESFDRATRAQYVLYSKFLGPLRRILIQQLPSSCDNDEDDSKGWYLDRIEVHGPDGERYTFPCSSWFGCNLVGEETCTERNLIVAADHRDIHRSSLHDPAHRLTQPLLVDASGYSMPHPDKVRAGTKGMNRKGMGYGGEDAYFYASNSNGIWAVGVADGVYEWRQVGIDAGAFSRQLMEYCRQAIELGTMDVLRVLQFASKHLRRCETLGSSTVCLGIVDTLQGRLATATIGDSGFILLGRSRENYMSSTLQGTYYIRYRSPQQEHSFGCPYQLGHQEGADNPEDAMLSTMPLYPGDVLIIGSDGLFDNVADENIVETVNKVLAEGGKPNELSQALAFQAFQASTDKAATTPYSVAASEAFEMIYNGGKADDITVVTAIFN